MIKLMLQRLMARGYTNADEAQAFRIGYNRGYHYRLDLADYSNSRFHRYWPNAHAAGFNEGRGDREAKTN